jgi:hypothetical protein
MKDIIKDSKINIHSELLILSFEEKGLNFNPEIVCDQIEFLYCSAFASKDSLSKVEQADKIVETAITIINNFTGNKNYGTFEKYIINLDELMSAFKDNSLLEDFDLKQKAVDLVAKSTTGISQDNMKIITREYEKGSNEGLML